jgi:ubiquinone/menaquinone biosynthesis C-methylase UbiE
LSNQQKRAADLPPKPARMEITMDYLQLLMDLHKDGERQGPGSDAYTEKAIALAGLDRNVPLSIADIGCGTGASTLTLARHLNARITAVDFLQDFLDVLQTRAASEGLSGKIETLCRPMEELTFDDESFDVIWSEGAIYNIGFNKGIRDWRRFLKPGGVLVVSEITWLTAERPAELQQFWDTEYPEINLASAKIALLEQSGYEPVAFFTLPEDGWLNHYYRPLQQRFPDFLARHASSPEATAVVDAEQREIALYEKHRAHFSYGVYIARKTHGI